MMADHDQSNAALPVAFNRFIELMNQDSAKDLVRSINTFMKEFKHRAPHAEVDSQSVQAFLQQMETAMAKHPLFAKSTPQEQDAATEALEKYLMTKLHERTFRQNPDDVERDELLALRCAALQFVGPEHLEIPQGIVDEAALARAAAELNKINSYKAPRDKLVCILNCCRMLNSLLATRSKAEGIGADDFTPLLIYLVIRAQTPALASNLAYIERYRYHAKLTSETQYYYIQLCGAATFIEMMDATSLKVHPDEFIAHMLAAGAMSEEQLAMMQSSSSVDGSSLPSSPQRSSTRSTMNKSTAQAVAAATAAGIQGAAAAVGPPPPSPPPPPYSPAAPQQQQHSPAGGWHAGQRQQPPQQQLQMQALPAGGGNSGWGAQQQAGGHGGGAYHQQQQQQQQHYQHGQYQQHPQQQYLQQQQQQQYNYHNHQQQYQQQQQPRVPLAPLPSVAELEAQGSALLAAKGAGVSRQLAARHPLSCSSLDSLSLGDVGKLLAAYKELVLRHEALTAALEHHHHQQQQQQQQAGVPAAAWPSTQQQPAAAQAVAQGPVPPPPPPPPPPPGPVEPAAAAAAAAAAAPTAPSAAAMAHPSMSLPGTPQLPVEQPYTEAPISPPRSAGAAPAPQQQQQQQLKEEGQQTKQQPASAGAAIDAAPHPEAAAAAAPDRDLFDILVGNSTAAAAPAAAVNVGGGSSDGADQRSEVDALLDDLLDEQPQQQQQQQGSVDAGSDAVGVAGTGHLADPGTGGGGAAAAAASNDDDLFGLFHQSSTSQPATPAAGAGRSTDAPSLLD